jgi:hypothetical protein
MEPLTTRQQEQAHRSSKDHECPQQRRFVKLTTTTPLPTTHAQIPFFSIHHLNLLMALKDCQKHHDEQRKEQRKEYDADTANQRLDAAGLGDPMGCLYLTGTCALPVVDFL